VKEAEESSEKRRRIGGGLSGLDELGSRRARAAICLERLAAESRERQSQKGRER